MNRFFIVTAILSLIILISCSTDKDTWNTAKINNDIPSYEYYIKKYLKGDHADSARLLIDELKNKPPSITYFVIPPIALWNNKNVDSLSLQVSITFNFLSKEFKKKKEIEYYNKIKDLLNNIGIIVVPQNSKYTAQLKVNLNVKAIRSTYYSWGYLYSGNELEGMISLTSERETPITVTINEKKPCPQHLSLTEIKMEAMKNPAYVLNERIIEKYLFDFFYNVWGSSPLVWLDTYDLYALPKFNIVSKELDKIPSKDLINNIIRACCSENRDLSMRAKNIVYSNSFKSTIGSCVLKERDPVVFEVIPILIQSKRIGILEILTGKSYEDKSSNSIHKDKKELMRWKKWWFNNKQSLVEQ